MNEKIKILHFEDSVNDAQAIGEILQQTDLFSAETKIVETKEKFIDAINKYFPDVILSTHSILNLNSHEALVICQNLELEIPFILVTSAMSDEFAVDILKRGASDYIVKHNLKRLPSAILKSIEEFQFKSKRQSFLQQIINNESRFRTLIENTGDGMAILSAEGNPLYVSPSIEKLLGYTLEESMHLDLLALAHPEDISILMDIMNQAMAKPGVPITGKPTRMKHKNGTWRWMDGVITNMCHDPELNGIVDNFRDVTDKILAEKILKDSEEKYRSFFNNNMDGILLTITDGKILAANPAACRMFQMTEEEICEAGRKNLLDPTDKRVQQGLERRQKHGKVKSEVILVRKDGTHFPGEVASTVFQDSNGEERTSMIVRDLTDHKKTQKAIIELQSNLQSIFDHTSEGFVLTDNKGIIKTYNNKAHQFIFNNIDGLINAGKSIYDFIDEDRKERFTEVISKVLSGKTITYDHCYKTKDGKLTWLNFVLNPVFTLGKIEGICITGADITQRKEIEVNLTQSELRLKDAQAVADIGSWENDYKKTEVTWSDQTYIIFETSAETFTPTYEAFLNFIIPEDRKRVNDVHTNAIDKDILYTVEYCITTGKGNKKYIEERWYILQDKNGKAAKAIGTCQNITEQKNNNQIIVNSQANLTAIIENTDAFIYSLDTDLKYITFNSALKNQLKNLYNVDLKPGYDVFDFIKKFEPLREEEWRVNYAKVLSGETLKFVREFVTEDYRVYTNFSLHPILENGKVIGVSNFVHDITEKVIIKEKQKQSEDRFRQIVETAQEGIWLLDENNLTTFVNEKLCSILEYPQEELLGKELNFFIDDSGKHTASKILSRKKKTIKGNIDVPFRTKSGIQIFTNIAINPIFDDNGIYKGMLGMVSDITDKKNLKDLFDKASSLARIGSYELDLITKRIFWSDITKEIHEVESSFIPEIETAINFYKEGWSKESINLGIQNAIKQGIPLDLQLQIVTARGNEKWVRVLGEAKFSDGKCIKVTGSFQDIDKTKKAEIELLNAYEEKNVILESIGDAFFAVDNNWIVTYWNKHAEKLLFKKREEMIDKNLWEVFSDAVDTPFYSLYQNEINENTVQHFEAYYEPFKSWYEVSAYPAHNGLSVYFKDITKKKISDLHIEMLNEELQKNVKELAVSNKELEDFAYVASHDLQEPLRMVTGFLGQIEKKYSNIIDDKGKQYIHFAVDGAKRMRQIILDLLEFSRVGRGEDKEELIDINQIIKTVIMLCQKQIKERKAIISYENMPSIKSFKTPLRQIFQNLVSNGIKYSKKSETPILKISAEETESHWQFTVADNGIGIEEEYFNKIFVIFQRLHNKDEYSGTGLGLAICKKIIDNLGGNIWLESIEGEGSTFYFTIPKTIKNTISKQAIF